jgi:hypothetical protein
MLDFILMPVIVYIEKIVFLEKNTSKKREITQIKCWIELSSLVNRTGPTLSTSVLSLLGFILMPIITFEIVTGSSFSFISSTFRRKNVELLLSFRRLHQHLGLVNFLSAVVVILEL